MDFNQHVPVKYYSIKQKTTKLDIKRMKNIILCSVFMTDMMDILELVVVQMKISTMQNGQGFERQDCERNKDGCVTKPSPHLLTLRPILF